MSVLSGTIWKSASQSHLAPSTQPVIGTDVELLLLMQYGHAGLLWVGSNAPGLEMVQRGTGVFWH